MSHGGDHSPNYDYVVATAERLSPRRDGRFLDFGCGRGKVVELGLERGLDFVGADTFATFYTHFLDGVPQPVRDRIFKYETLLPFEDQSFDVVTANMVFEHVPDLGPTLSEINRVLRPDGVLLALFPVAETAYEGHAGLYCAHWLRRRPSLQARYFRTAHKLGFGLYREGYTSESWADVMVKSLGETCVYHRGGEVMRRLRIVFGSEPRSLAADYVGYRLERSRFSALTRRVPRVALDPLLRGVCGVRAGKVIAVTKARPLP
ncbi:MAG TPA: class I SAM-dependent methyltransferase [Hyphomicrobiaceae bacterium]|nr:class I SAM-dependent methyltransferase [Hyphomicrobiaceae bacterium]